MERITTSQHKKVGEEDEDEDKYEEEGDDKKLDNQLVSPKRKKKG
jgi:hypothetical protein